ncbi:MAG: sugar phosphate isomerase/epimerase family protein [Acidimicrobiales bacterium]|jgi:sugar phosphate isomerase/epimerase
MMRATLPDLVAVAGSAGFDAVSITPAMYADALASGMSVGDIRRRCSDAGVEVSLIDPLMSALPGSPDPDHAGGRFGALFRYGEDDCYRIAEALDVGTVNVAHYMGAEVPVAALIDALGTLCGRAASHGLRVLLEFMPEGSVPDLATALAIVRATGAANLAVMLDTWHFFRTGGTLNDLEGLAPGEVGGLQASDAPAAQQGMIEARVNTRLLPGEGAIPVAAVIDRVLTGDPDAFIGVEVFSDDLNHLTLAEAAARARASMREVMA